MILTGVGRLGADAEVRYTAGGEPVATLSLAWNYGRKGEDGKRPSQWVRASLWGKRAESLAEFLVKGSSVWVALGDVHVREWEANGKSGVSLEGRVLELDFVGGRSDPGAKPATIAKAPARGAPVQAGFPDDDVPF
jgi:single-strand DNA-binding protein